MSAEDPGTERAPATLAHRPAPRAGFRGRLRERLAASAEGLTPRPANLRRLVGAYATAAAVLLAAALLSVAGVGPLGA